MGDAERFLRDAWTRRPHLHRSGSDFADLLSLDDVDRILSTLSPRAPAFRLVRQGRPVPREQYTRRGTLGGRTLDDLPDVGRIFALFDDGATIVLQGLHRYWETVTRFCRDLELALTHPVQANAYLTPPVASGLDVHHDTHDVFALQTYGRKQWVTYAPVVDQPLTSQPWSRSLGDPGTPTLDVELLPGDCLYVPRGARTVDAASLHLTVGIRSITWHDVVHQLLAATTDELSFREALPAGFADDPDRFAPAVAAKLKELAGWVAERDPAELAAGVVRRFWGGRSPVLDGQLRQLLERVDRIGQDSVLVRRAPA
ncbi:MAG TPA: cupin domain-containing protein, partial [Nitriliruptorales bacterium]|nr:cupin domain-containing protein [Nitriliruptorales bacterium]